MLKNEELFKIENHTLYREKNLIDLQIPVFFVCKDNDEKRYLVLLTDFEEDEYLICPITESDLLKMLKAQMPMREAYARASKIYMVRASKSIDNDIVKVLKYAEVEDDMLPEDGAFFEIDNRDLQEYVIELTESKIDYELIKANADGLSALVKGVIDGLVSENYANLVVNIKTIAEVLVKYDDFISNYAKVFTDHMTTAAQALAAMTDNISSQYEVSIEADCEYVSPEYVEKENNSFSYSSADTETSYYHIGEYISIKVA